MLTSMFTAVSGMNANGTSLSVISDNIANLNTVGFKSSRVEFGDVLSQSMSGASQIGRGVQVLGVSPLFTQGSFESTASGLDLSIDGDGFFMVNDGASRYYTRAGQFSISKDGNIVNPDNMVLQGYLTDAAGNISGDIGSLQVSNSQSAASMTGAVEAGVNLDATARVYDPLVPAQVFTLGAGFDTPTNFNSSSTVTVYDSQGGSHPVTLYFVKTAANTWVVHYVQEDPLHAGQLMQAGQTSAVLPAPAVPTGAPLTQTLTFNASGALLLEAGATPTFSFAGAGIAVTSPQTIAFNYGTSVGEGGTGLDMSTQFASSYSVLSLNQDGYGAGSLKSVSVSDTGIVSGSFTNGQTRDIGQVALARFISPKGLTKNGRNLFAEAFDSGQPVVGVANTSGIGKVTSNSLELSNVDLASEFVNMITAQRAFQANSRVITATDELMQNLVNLGR